MAEEQDSIDNNSERPNTAEFAKAQAVINDSCIQCHSVNGQASFAPFDLANEQDFINRGWIIPGDPENSKLIYRMRGFSSLNPAALNRGGANMPPAGEFRLSEFNIIKNWVLAMAVEEDTEPPVVTITSPVENFETEEILNLSGSCELGAGNVRITGSLSQATTTPCIDTGIYSVLLSLSEGLGSKKLTVTQRDQAGNVGMVSRIFIRAIDPPPLVQITAPSARTTDPTGLVVSGVCEVGASAVTIGGDVMNVGAITNCSANGDFTAEILFTDGLGDKVITVAQQDAQNKVGNDMRTFRRIAEPIIPPTTSADPVQRFADAKQVLGEFCIICHRAGGEAATWDFNFQTERQFVDLGFVVPGEIDSSKLVNRMIHYNGPAGGLRNMPKGNKQALFTTGHYNLIKDWVAMMDPMVGRDPASNPDPTNPFTCNDPTTTSKTLSYSLTKKQYENSMRLFFGDNFVDNMASSIDLIPEESYTKYERKRLTGISPNLVEIYQNVAIAMANAVKNDPAKFDEIFGNCGNSVGTPPQGLTTIFSESNISNGSVFQHQAAYELMQGTIEMVITPNAGDLSGNKGLFSKDHTGYGNGGHLSIYIDGGQLKSRLQSANGEFPLSISGVKAGEKNHIVVSFGNGNHKIYLNGNLAQTATYTGGLIGQTQPIVIGALNWSSQPGEIKITNSYTGDMDFVKIYGSQLSDAQVTQLANSNNLNNTPYCLDSYLDGLAKMIYRRPLTAQEKAFAQTLVDKGIDLTDGLSIALAYHLQSPHFIMRMELGNANDMATEFELTPYEVATRLAFGASDTGPDQNLLDLATNGSIMNLVTMKQETRRLLNSPRGKGKVRDILLTWSHNDSVSSLSPLPASIRTEYGDLGELEVAMIREAGEFVDYVVFNQGGNFLDLMTSKASFARNTDLAKIYGHTALTLNTADPATMVGRRQGLWMRAPALAYSAPRTSIIERGVAFQADVLCNELPSPPDDVVDQRDDVTFTEIEQLEITNRYMIAQITSSDTCMVCHSKINPTGNAFESIGPLGELRVEENIFNNQGVFHQSLPIDTSGIVPLNLTQSTPVNDAFDLVQNVGESSLGKACFARKVFRLINEKRENQGDSCQLQPMYAEINSEDGSVLEAFVNVIANEAVKRKKKE